MTALKTIIVGFGSVADTLGADEKMIRWFGPSSHAQIVSRHPAFDWTAVIDPSPEARARAHEKWKISACHASLSQLEDVDAIECAVLATPPDMRIDVVNALPNLRAVMVEKPLGRNIKESTEFIELCDERGIHVQVPYWRRAVATYQELAEGGLEDLVGVPQAIFGLYGNGLLNNGSHLVDFMRYLFGDVVSCDALNAGKRPAGGPISDDIDAQFVLHFSSELCATVQSLNFDQYREVGLDVWGSRGRLSILQEGLGIYHFPVKENRGLSNEREVDSGNPESLGVAVQDCFQRLYDNLAHSVVNDVDLISSGRSALETEKVVLGIAEAATNLVAA